MKELTQEEMTSLKGGFFDENEANVIAAGNDATATNAAVNVAGIQLAKQYASADAGNQYVRIRQIA
jgi:hypothetical protein